MGEPDPSSWSARAIARKMLANARAHPLSLLLALVVLPTVWEAPAEALYDRTVPDPAETGSTVSIVTDALVLAATTLWWSVWYGGQVQIAVDVARGAPVDWSRFRSELRHAGRLAATAVPILLPIAGILHIPEGAWLEAWALSALVTAVASAIVLAARTVLWAPFLTDAGLPLVRALGVGWTATRGQTWALIRLGLVLSLPLVPLFALEGIVLGSTRLSSGILGGLYTLAVGHLYMRIRPSPTPDADPRVAASTAPAEPDADLPQAGSGWSRPFE